MLNSLSSPASCNSVHSRNLLPPYLSNPISRPLSLSRAASWFGAASLFNEPFSQICFTGVPDHPELLVKTLSRGEIFFPPFTPLLLAFEKLSCFTPSSRTDGRIVEARSIARTWRILPLWSLCLRRVALDTRGGRFHEPFKVCLEVFYSVARVPTAFPVDYACYG